MPVWMVVFQLAAGSEIHELPPALPTQEQCLRVVKLLNWFGAETERTNYKCIRVNKRRDA